MDSVAAGRHCIAVVKGKACPGYRHGLTSSYCYPHDPTISAEERRANAAKGGHAGRGKRRIRIGDRDGALRFVSLTLNALFNRMDGDTDRSLDVRLTRALTVLMRLLVPLLQTRKPAEPNWHA